MQTRGERSTLASAEGCRGRRPARGPGPLPEQSLPPQPGTQTRRKPPGHMVMTFPAKPGILFSTNIQRISFCPLLYRSEKGQFNGT